MAVNPTNARPRAASTASTRLVPPGALDPADRRDTGQEGLSFIDHALALLPIDYRRLYDKLSKGDVRRRHGPHTILP